LTGLQIAVLSIIQGLTEFLPISSSAHLIVGSRVFGWPDQGLVFDVATHLGTLIAVLIYFRAELGTMIVAALRGSDDSASASHRRLLYLLIGASIPALVVGWLASDLVERHLRDLRIIAWTTVGFGIALWVADRLGRRHRALDMMTWRAALTIGLAQVLALIPGTSRSGITMTAARLLGFDATSAARFSFLLSIPVIGAAGGYGALRIALGGEVINWAEFGMAVALSAATGWVCIAAFLALLERVGLTPFVLYRLGLGLVLLYLLY
jgi:undecaprenyl-diphosphatase